MLISSCERLLIIIAEYISWRHYWFQQNQKPVCVDTEKCVLIKTIHFSKWVQTPISNWNENNTHRSLASRKALAKGLCLIFNAVICVKK